MVHSFLLIGQSNAAGRGFLEEAKPLDPCDGKVKMLRNGRFIKAFRPINPDRYFSGSCLAESFAKAYVTAHPEVDAGIIPCADGGTKLDQWMPGGILFDHAVSCAKLAMRSSHLMGVLWHQGEGDSTPELYSSYAERFKIVMDALRQELNCPDLPILVGGLGDFLPGYTKSEYIGTYYKLVNEQLKKLEREYPNCRFVSAEGLGSNPDHLHFSAEALEEFGVRYFNELTKMDLPELRGEICDASELTELEKL